MERRRKEDRRKRRERESEKNKRDTRENSKRGQAGGGREEVGAAATCDWVRLVTPLHFAETTESTERQDLIIIICT